MSLGRLAPQFKVIYQEPVLIAIEKHFDQMMNADFCRYYTTTSWMSPRGGSHHPISADKYNKESLATQMNSARLNSCIID